MFLVCHPIRDERQIFINVDQICTMQQYPDFVLIKTSDGANHKVKHEDVAPLLDLMEKYRGEAAVELVKKDEKPAL